MSFIIVVLVVSVVSMVVSFASLWWTVRHLKQCGRLLRESREIRMIYYTALVYYARTENNGQACYALEKALAVPVDGKAGVAK